MRFTHVLKPFVYGSVRVNVEMASTDDTTGVFQLRATQLTEDDIGVVRSEPMLFAGDLLALEQLAADLGRGAIRASAWLRECDRVLKGKEEAAALTALGLRLKTKK